MPILDEKKRRIVLGALIDFFGRGSLKNIHKITGVSQVTLISGRREAESITPDTKARPTAEEGKHLSQPIHRNGKILSAFPPLLS